MKKNSIISLVLFLIISLTAVSQNIPTYIPANGLVAWYPFSGNFIDSSGNNRHLVSYGSPALTTDRYNQNNRAYNFNHSQSQYFANSNFPTTYNSYTISAWVKISNVINYPAIQNAVAGPSIILGQSGCNSTNCSIDVISSIGFNTHLNGSQFQFSGRHRNSNGNYLGTNTFNLNTEWNFIAEVWNGNKIYLYLNNNLIDSTTTSGISPLTNSFYIGAGYFNQVYYYFSGKIDDIGIWSRTLSSQEISNIYNSSIVTNNLTVSNYPILPIDSIQFVNNSRLTNDTTTLPDYISPTFKNTTYRDTVRFEGVVVSNPQVYGLSTFRKGAYIQRIGGGPWSGVLVMCEPSGTGTTLANLKTETNFYSNFIPGKRVRVTGVIRDFQGETQINLIRNNVNYSNAIDLLSQSDTAINYSEISVDELMVGNPSTGNWSQQKQTGERWEGVPVILKNVTVNTITRFANNLRFNWTVIDEHGNQIEIRDFSGYYRRDGNSDSITLNVIDTNRFTPPPLGTKLDFIRGIVNEYNVNGTQRYTITPIRPDDIKINRLSLSTNQCIYRNKLFTINIKQYNLVSDSAFLEFSKNLNFDTILHTDTFSQFNQNTSQIEVISNLTVGDYKVRLRLKNNLLNSSPINIKIKENNTNLINDTIIAFKRDSIFLSAPNNYLSYKWSNEDSSSDTWIKHTGLIKLVAEDSSGCKQTDSSTVIFIGGISQKDTTICAGSTLSLSIKKDYPMSGIVGYWPFNANANDESGNEINGVIINAQQTTNRFGEPSKAYYFNGVSSRIVTNAINTNNWDGLTITYWCKQNTLINGQVFDLRSSNQNDVASYHEYGSPKANNYSSQINNSIFLNSNDSLSIGTWNNVTITQNYNTNRFSIYINGELKNTISVTPYLLNAPYFNIGSRSSSAGNSNYFTGYLDDIAIWKRALSENEIKYMQFNKFNNNWSPNDTLTVIHVKPKTDTTVYCSFEIGSFRFMDSIKITVNPSPERILPDTSIAFKIDSLKLNAKPGYSTYSWNINDTNDFIWTKYNGIFKVTVKNQFGCTSVDSTRAIFLKGISIKDTMICRGNSLVLRSTDSIANYLWSNSQNSSLIVVSPDSTTQYYLESRIGRFTIKDSVIINVRELPGKQITPNKLGLCINDTIKLTANPGYNYTWFKNSLAISANRALMVNQPGKYLVHLTDSFGCENTSDTLNIFNAPIPSLNFNINDSIQCYLKNNFLFEDNSTIDSGSYQRKWVFGNTPQISDSKQTNWSNIGIGVYPIKLIVTTNYACSDSLVKNIVVKNNPSIGNMTGDSVGLSTSIPYVYAISQQPNHSYQWTVTNGIILNGQGTNVITVQWLNNGKGNIKAEIIDIFGCSDTITKNINIGSVGIRDINKTNKYLIYPNPSNGVFTIEITSDSKDYYSLKLINSLGQIIHTESKEVSEGINKIYLSKELPSGVYKLTIENADSNNHQTIIIK